MNNSPLNTAGIRFIEKMRTSSPIIYAAIKATENSGMGSLGGVWDNIGEGLGTILKQAPSIYQNTRQAKNDLKRAEESAEFELEQAKLQIQLELIGAENDMRRYQSQQNIAMLEQATQRRKLLETEYLQADGILSSLTSGQKTGLFIGLGLATALLLMARTGR